MSSALIRLGTPLALIMDPWHALGYAVIPGNSPTEKRPLAGRTWAEHCGAVRAERAPWTATMAVIKARNTPNNCGLLLLSSNTEDMPDLAVIDVDNMDLLTWVIATFGDSPLHVSSGRQGGGVHVYYQLASGVSLTGRNGQWGPPEAWHQDSRGTWKTKIDIKAARNYVVAPGSLHASGRVYTPSIPITRENILALPVLDAKLVDKLVGVGKPSAIANMPAIAGVAQTRVAPWHKPKQTAGGSERRAMDGHAARIGSGKCAGLTPFEAAKRVADGTRIGCPHHSSDSGRSAQLHIDGDNVSIYCHICHVLYTYGSEATAWTAPMTVPVDDTPFDTLLAAYNASAASAALAPSPAVRVPGNPRKVALPVDSRGHIDAGVVGRLAARSDVLILQAGQGRGKTHGAVPIVRGVMFDGGRAIVSSPRKALSREATHRFGPPCYLDHPDGEIEGSISVCTPSLPRAVLETQRDYTAIPLLPDIEVADEINQQLRELAGDHLSHQQAREGYFALLNHLRTAKKLILLDADISPLVIRALKLANRWDERVIWAVAPPAPARDSIVWGSKAEWLTDVLDAASQGKRLFLAVDSLDGSETFSKMLDQHRWNDRPTLVVNKNTGIADLNSTLATAGHVVATRVISTGVSIDDPTFDRVYAWLSNNIGTAEDVQQFVNRVRNPQDRCLRLCIQPGGRHPEAWEASEDAIFARMVAKEASTLKAVGFHRVVPDDLVTYEDGQRVFRPDAEAFSRFWAAVHVENVRNGHGRSAETWVDRQVAGGAQVVRIEPLIRKPPEVAAVAEAAKVITEEVVLADAQLVVEAEDLDDDQAKRLQRSGPRNPLETLQLRKLGLQRFYGGKLSVDIVLWDDRGRGRSKARSYAQVCAIAEGGQAENSLRTLDYNELKAGVGGSHLRHRYARSKLLLKLAKMLGLEGALRWTSLGDEVEPVKIDPANVNKLVDWVQTTPKAAQGLSIYGIKVRKDVQEKPMQLVGAVAKACGLHVASAQQRDGVERGTRVYTVDMADLETTQAMARDYLERLRSGAAIGLDGHDIDIDAAINQIRPEGTLTDAGALQLLEDLCS